MNKIILIIFILSGVIINTMQGQEITISGSQFLYEGQSYSLRELEPILSHDLLIMEIYNKAVKSRSMAKGFGIVSLSSFAMSGLFTTLAITQKGEYTGFKQVAAMIFAGSGIISGGISIFQFKQSRGHTKRAVDFYNRTVQEDVGFVPNETNIFVSPSGVGISYRF